MAVTAMNPAITNTFMTAGTNAAGTLKEDLSDVIYQIDSDETPLVTALPRVPAGQPLTEWTVDDLADADENAQPEGWRYRAQPIVGADRLNNVCQLMVRSVTVSGSLRRSRTVGGDEYDRQMINKAKEVRRDLEWAITRDRVKSLTDPRRMAGIPSYLTQGSAGATGAMPTGDGSDGHTAGTARAMTLDLVTDAMQLAYASGGKPDMAIVSPVMKRKFSGLAQGGSGNPTVATNTVQATEARAVTIVGAVDVYLSDFGPVNVVPDRFAPNGQLLIVDVDYAELAPLDGADFMTEDYAKTGDADDGAVIFEGCVRVTAPLAHAVLFDLIST